MAPVKVSRFAALIFIFRMLVASMRTLFASLDGGCTLVSYVSSLNIPSNGSTSGSHASNCMLKVDAAIEEISTAFIASGWPCVASLILVIVRSNRGVIIPHKLSTIVTERHLSFISAVMFSCDFGFTASPIVNANRLDGFLRSERARKVQA
uniref:Uncharacterized protein LOC8261314 n=1 Tax=Rhizophora mucronata TaxID=61149 RepID=A0A2P2MA78_RHIMU